MLVGVTYPGWLGQATEASASHDATHGSVFTISRVLVSFWVCMYLALLLGGTQQTR